MTDEPTTKTDSTRTPDLGKQGVPTSGSGQTGTSPDRLTQGDPLRRGFGERSIDASKKAEPAKGPYPLPGAQTDEDGGEYDKGPRAEATTKSAPTKGAPDLRAVPMQHKDKPAVQPLKVQPGKTDEKSASDGKSSRKDQAGKSADSSGGTCTP